MEGGLAWMWGNDGVNPLFPRAVDSMDQMDGATFRCNSARWFAPNTLTADLFYPPHAQRAPPWDRFTAWLHNSMRR